MSSLLAAKEPVPSYIKHTVPLYAKDTQYLITQYALTKLQALIVQSKAILIKVKNNNDPSKPMMIIPLIHFIISMLGTTIDDQSDDLKKKIFSLSRLIPLIKAGKTFRLENFGDSNDDVFNTNYAIDSPYKIILEQLIEILDQILNLQKKKAQAILIDREKLALTKIDPIVFKDLMNPSELQSMFNFITTKDKLSSYQFDKIPIFLNCIEKSLSKVENFNKLLKAYKLKPSDGTLKKVPNWQFIIHRIITSYIILLDQYSSLRIFGKNLYSPMKATLKNPKLAHLNNSLVSSLKKLEEFFIHPEKNGLLISQISKYNRNGTIIQVDHKTLIDLLKIMNHSIDLNKQLINTIQEFVKIWLALDPTIKKIEEAKKEEVETAKNQNSTPKASPKLKLVTIIPNTTRPQISSPVSPIDAKHILEERQKKELQIKERQKIDNINNKRKIESRERELREGLKESTNSTASSSPEIKPSRIRSNSNASMSSNSSLNSSIKNSVSPPVLTSRISSPTMSSRVSSPPTLSRTSSLQIRRPLSVYHSNAAFDIRSEMRRQERAAAAAVSGSRTSSITNSTPRSNSITNRPRSSSLQSLPTLSAKKQPLHHATAAAAATLNNGQQAMKNQYRSSSLSTINETRKYFVDSNNQDGLSRSPSPLRSLKKGLDDIMETPAKSITQQNFETPIKATEKLPISPLKSSLKNSAPTSVSKNEVTPKKVTELVNEIKCVQIEDIDEVLNDEEAKKHHDDKTNEKETKEGEEAPKTLDPIAIPTKIVKKVRFTGVPDSPPNKRKLWKPLSKQFSPQRNKTSLTYAAEALKEERLAFHSIRKIESNNSNNKAELFKEAVNKNGRMMNTLVPTTPTAGRTGKWSSFKDRFV